jgi:hypothetical protein
MHRRLWGNIPSKCPPLPKHGCVSSILTPLLQHRSRLPPSLLPFQPPLYPLPFSSLSCSSGFRCSGSTCPSTRELYLHAECGLGCRAGDLAENIGALGPALWRPPSALWPRGASTSEAVRLPPLPFPRLPPPARTAHTCAMPLTQTAPVVVPRIRAGPRARLGGAGRISAEMEGRRCRDSWQGRGRFVDVPDCAPP